jgi:hypothetical protein
MIKTAKRPPIPRYSGHFSGHVRDAFLEALELWANWKEGEPEPTVEIEVNYEPYTVPISERQ